MIPKSGSAVNGGPDLEESRRKILDAIGAPPDLTFVRAPGNAGDRLIEAGTRRLLAGLAFREVGISGTAAARGHTAVLAGSGGWCRPYQEIMPGLLERLESRFRKIVVLPSSFEISVPRVREALERTKAVIFAREPESYR